MAALDALTVIIPARNEQDALPGTLARLESHPGPILVVDDYSTDATASVCRQQAIRCLPNTGPAGYGGAIQTGIRRVGTDYLTIMTADGSDDPATLERFMEQAGAARLVFADRWMEPPREYPQVKRWANRAGNRWIAWKRRTVYQDWTDPFKCYPTEIARSLLPLEAGGMSAGLELALRASRTAVFAVVPTRWQNRRAGRSKFRAGTVAGYLRTAWRWV